MQLNGRNQFPTCNAKFVNSAVHAECFFSESSCFQRFMVKAHTSDIRMTYEYIPVTCGWHTSTYQWHTDDIRVHTSTYRWHTSTYEWHTDDIRVHTDDIQVHMSDIRMAVTYTVANDFLLPAACSKFSLLYSMIKSNDLASLNKYLFWC